MLDLGHDFSGTASNSSFRVTFISRNENVNHITFFCFIFFIPFKFLKFFRQFTVKNSVMESKFSNVAGVSSVKDVLVGVFCDFRKIYL